MSSGSSPPAPDYAGAAQATADSSEKVNNAQTYANRPNVYTPWGSQTWTPGRAIDPATGKPVTVWDQSIQLSPDQQAALNSQTAISTARSNAALSMLPGVLRGFGLNPSSYNYGTPAAPAPPPVRVPPSSSNEAAAGIGAVMGAILDPNKPGQRPFYPGAAQGVIPVGEGGNAGDAGASGAIGGSDGGIGEGGGAVGGIGGADGLGLRGDMRTAQNMMYSQYRGDGESSAGALPVVRQTPPAPAAGTPPPPAGSAGQGFWFDDGQGGQVWRGWTGGPNSITAGGQAISPTTTATGGGSSGAPFSYGGGVTVDPNYWRAAGQGAALGFQAPLQQQRQQALETQLSNMGLPRGSQAWTNEMRILQDQNARDNLQAFGAGQSESNMLFNQALQANGQGLAAQNQAFGQNLASQGANQALRQSQIAEMLQARAAPLNEMNALLSGQQIGMPQFPGATPAGKAQGVDLMNAAANSYGAQLGASNAANAASASNTQAGISAAGTIAMLAYMYSDARLKRDIEYLFTLPNGIKVYKYEFIGRGREIGVIAQEVREIMPEAVHEDGKGYLKVDYDMVLK